MPWNEVKPMNERIRFISDYLSRYFPISELCYRYGISRKTGYKWINRFNEEGSLEEHSRRPNHSPNETNTEILRLLLDLRDKLKISIKIRVTSLLLAIKNYKIIN